jgi:hypothetical protein
MTSDPADIVRVALMQYVPIEEDEADDALDALDQLVAERDRLREALRERETATQSREYHAVDPRMCRVACGGGECKAPTRTALSKENE